MPDLFSLPPAARDAILGWYERHGRPLPFRRTNDPYAVLVSEAMAQQTQAARAGDAWIRFMERFPDVGALAAASPGDVLRAWQGLGYNRRALNLWRAAVRIMGVHDGRVPSDLLALQALPGVGPYTARAVAAIAFGRPVGAVDTNVRRVLGRIVQGDAAAPGSVAMQALADAVVPPERPADWTHALMDLGATVCRARNPDCGGCPAREWCRFAAEASDDQPCTPPGPPQSGVRDERAPFPSTPRWLRGRIVERLRAGRDGAWTVVDGPIGIHDRAAVAAALRSLSQDGLVEFEEVNGPGATWRARLPIT